MGDGKAFSASVVSLVAPKPVRLWNKKPSPFEENTNGMAFIEAAGPKNEIEAALAIQMACTHAVTMAVLSRAGGAYGGDRHVAIVASAGARLLNAFSAQLETMRRLRNGGTQVIRVERIEVSDGAQAVIGNVKATSSTRDG